MQRMTLVTAVAALGLAACGTAGKRVIGEQATVLSMPSKAPGWVDNSKAFYEEKGLFFYRGSVWGVSDAALGIREAGAEAEKNLVNEVSQSISAQFAKMKKGENKDGALAEQTLDFIQKVSANVQISGVKLTEQFVEQKDEVIPGGVRYFWNCHALVSVSKDDYLLARRSILDAAVQKARLERNSKLEADFKRLQEKFDAASAPAAVPLETAAVEENP